MRPHGLRLPDMEKRNPRTGRPGQEPRPAYHYVLPWLRQMRPSQFGLQGVRRREPSSPGTAQGPSRRRNSAWSSTGCHTLRRGGRCRKPTATGGTRQLGRGPGRPRTCQFPGITGSSDDDWMIDRQVQKYETFTGIEGINTQDQAVQESMGAIVDRSTENLAVQ